MTHDTLRELIISSIHQMRAGFLAEGLPKEQLADMLRTLATMARLEREGNHSTQTF